MTHSDSAIILAAEVLGWWDKHQYDCDGSYNVYDEPPAFVQPAIRINLETTPARWAELTNQREGDK